MERGALIAGRYELTEPLGRGGMGEVWAARDRRLHRDVAVKLLLRGDDAAPELIQRFEREAVAAAQVNHPNIVALYDSGTHGHLRFLVMEHVEGISLARYLQRQGPPSLDRALEIAQGICAALVAAHEAHVIHYDIKPSNVMLTADGSVKVVDFGIAGFTHTHTFTVAPTTALSPGGTAQFGAPEQFLDQRGDERSDLYALGSVLFALLTGEPPFGDGSPLAVIRRKLDEEPPRVTGLRPEVPAPVARLLADLLRRDPEDRPGTATVVQRRLGQLLIDTVARDIRDDATEPLPPSAATRALTTDRPETVGAAGGADGADAGSGEAPASARRRPASRLVGLLAALSIPLVLVPAIAYYVATERRDGADHSASESATSAPRYQRMPDFCGHLQRNELRGRQELAAYELSETANDSTHANCGWEGSGNPRFELIISAELHASEELAVEEIAALTPGRGSLGDATLSEVEDTAAPGDEAMQSVRDESRGETADGEPYISNSTTVYFRQDNLFVTVRYREFMVTSDESGDPDRITELARQTARSLDRFLDEPENQEAPIRG
ncbi:serine/threonine-protein kinase [Streptomyces radicis]|uniref:serine/threonine-protein kinase n=1 Tax=Streptomyces radicis TaxID=1750517 RepID=UPI0016013244|nr:serine/threonine-protein kinase [Streptomyces radicis]